MSQTAVIYRSAAPAHVVGENGTDEYVLWPMRFASPLMRYMVNSVRQRRGSSGELQTNHLLFDGLGPLCRKIKEGAASWQALDIIYNYRGEGSLVDKLWIGYMRNAQAVRNRKRIISAELRELAIETAMRNGSVKVLSLASGSAQAVFEALANFPYPIEIMLIDFDRDAGPYAKCLAQVHGLSDVATFKTGNVMKFDRKVLLGEFQPDIIEMAGLLDYLREDEAIAIIGRVHALLPPDGAFITCHIHDNPEREFMSEIIDWGREGTRQRPMLYRSHHELVELVRKGGFDKLVIYTERHAIHSVAIARK
ncbi:MAG: class I SAM-dependent methyltransferase family protein [Candidatus Paceibacterota bacterium]